MTWTSRGVEEIRILRLLQEFDGGFACDYLQFVNRLYSGASGNPYFEWLTGSSTRTPIGFRVKLSGLPVHLLASHPISRFRRAMRYDIWRGERDFCAALGIIPVYFAEFGVYTVLKLWGERARSFFASEEALSSEYETCWGLFPQDGGCEFSSMNFLLRSHTREIQPNESTVELVRRGFVNGFWSFPRPGFACSAHLLHNQMRINTIIKVSKSVYSIERIEPGCIMKEPDNIQVEKAKMWGLDFEDDNPVMKPVEAVLATDIAEEIELNYRNRSFFVNGVVSEFRRRAIRFPALTVVAQYGTNSIDLIESLICIVAMRNFERSAHSSYVGSVDELRAKTNEILKVLHKKVRYERTIGDFFPDLFDRALGELAPLFITDGRAVYYYHPCLMSTLSVSGIAPKIDSDHGALVRVLKMMDATTEKRTPMALRMVKESDELVSSGYDKEEIIRCILKAFRFIEISKMLHRSNL